MKRVLLPLILFVFTIASNAQVTDTDVQSRLSAGERVTATTTAATRLFSDYKDLSSVQMIIPNKSVVEVVSIADLYYKVKYDDSEGYILKRQASVDATANVYAISSDERYFALIQKYDLDEAKAIYEHKIWKGMSGDMVADSWGDPKKKNRIIVGNVVNETWQYTTTWLYFENDTLSDWGSLE